MYPYNVLDDEKHVKLHYNTQNIHLWSWNNFNKIDAHLEILPHFSEFPTTVF